MKDRLNDCRYLTGLSGAWVSLLLKLMTYPLDDYVHNSTFIIPSPRERRQFKKLVEPLINWVISSILAVRI